MLGDAAVAPARQDASLRRDVPRKPGLFLEAIAPGTGGARVRPISLPVDVSGGAAVVVDWRR